VAGDPVTDQLAAPPAPAGESPDGVTLGGPSDNTTLVEVMARYAEQGYTGQFGVSDDALIRCFTCRRDSASDAVRVVSLRRMEGASDPADMIAVVALHCPNCDTPGVLALGYGPDSAPEESELLLHLEDRRGSERPEVPGAAAPGEVVHEEGVNDEGMNSKARR
jgi:hypothetical protein